MKSWLVRHQLQNAFDENRLNPIHFCIFMSFLAWLQAISHTAYFLGQRIRVQHTQTNQLLWPELLRDFVGSPGQSCFPNLALIESFLLEVFAFNGPGNTIVASIQWVECVFGGHYAKTVAKSLHSKEKAPRTWHKNGNNDVAFAALICFGHRARIQWVAQEPNTTSRQSTVGGGMVGLRWPFGGDLRWWMAGRVQQLPE